MSRRDVFDLSKAIDLYKENKDLENKLKKSNTEAGNVIKSYFLEKGISSASSEKYTATVTTTTKSTLNEDLANLCALRLANPEESLCELGKLAGITKSAVNYRLNKIMKIAKELKEE